MKNNQEIFKDVIGYENLYQVSNYGKVIAKARTIINKNNKLQFFNAKDRAISDNGNGYKKVELYKNNKGKTFYIHRLVFEAFAIKIPKDTDINHIDGNKANNHISNLELATRSENILHAFKLGLSKSDFGLVDKRSKTGYSNIGIKNSSNRKYFCVCIRHDKKRYERLFHNLSEAIEYHNSIMTQIGRLDLLHKELKAKYE